MECSTVFGAGDEQARAQMDFKLEEKIKYQGELSQQTNNTLVWIVYITEMEPQLARKAAGLNEA